MLRVTFLGGRPLPEYNGGLVGVSAPNASLKRDRNLITTMDKKITTYMYMYNDNVIWISNKQFCKCCMSLIFPKVASNS